MTTLSQTQIYLYAVSAGFTNPSVMSAIAMAESSGDPTVVNSIGCVGLWQINQPVWVKSHPTWTVAWLQNPENNAQAAKVVYNAQGLGAWETYTNGAYKKYTSSAPSSTSSAVSTAQAQNASWWGTLGNGLLGGVTGGLVQVNPDGSVGGLAGGIGGTVDSLGTIATDIGNAAAWTADPKNWVRVVYVIGGAALVIVGLAVVARPYVNSAVTSATNVVSGATPEGKLVSTVKSAASKAKKASAARAAKKSPAPEKKEGAKK